MGRTAEALEAYEQNAKYQQFQGNPIMDSSIRADLRTGRFGPLLIADLRGACSYH